MVLAQSNTAMQNQTAVTAYFSSKQLPLFVFALREDFLPLESVMGDHSLCTTTYHGLCQQHKFNCLIFK